MDQEREADEPISENELSQEAYDLRRRRDFVYEELSAHWWAFKYIALPILFFGLMIYVMMEFSKIGSG